MAENAGIGCYYKNNYYPLIYEFKKPPQIAITVRSNQDSFISADYITQGCSSSDIYEDYCITGHSKWSLFGMILISEMYACMIWAIVLRILLCHKMRSKKYERENL